MKENIGIGFVKRIEVPGTSYRKVEYIGTFPEINGERKVAILLFEDLEAIMKREINSLLASRLTMSEGFHNQFPDELMLTEDDQTEHKLFLQRYVCSPNFKDEVWIRYCSVDQSLAEEDASRG